MNNIYDHILKHISINQSKELIFGNLVKEGLEFWIEGYQVTYFFY